MNNLFVTLILILCVGIVALSKEPANTQGKGDVAYEQTIAHCVTARRDLYNIKHDKNMLTACEAVALGKEVL